MLGSRRSPRGRSKLDSSCGWRRASGPTGSEPCRCPRTLHEVKPLRPTRRQPELDERHTDISERVPPSDRLFEIPIYQRGYAWEEENLRDLWDDLDYLDDRSHYFGTILLKKANKKTRAGLRTFDHFEVIDGQQRLTTTLILLRELISQLKELGDEEMRDQASKLEEDYVGRTPHYKLTIGNENEDFSRDSILAGRSAIDPKTRAQERLRNARAFFRARFDQRREGQGRDRHRDFLIDFKSRIDRLQVMLYIVPSNAEAVRMFETVNDRGRPLTNLEKTKSILMYASYLVVDDPTTLDKLLSEMNSHFSEIYRCFQDIEEGLGLRDAGEIQRYHHVFFFGQRTLHKHMQVLKDRLMEKSRENREDCERFIRRYARSLRQAFGTMRDITRRRRDGRALGRAIDRLFLVGPVGNLYPLLIAAWQEFGEDSEREEVPRSVRGLRVPGLPHREMAEPYWPKHVELAGLSCPQGQFHRRRLPAEVEGTECALRHRRSVLPRIVWDALLRESRHRDDQVSACTVRAQAPEQSGRADYAAPRGDPLIRVRDGAYPASASGRGPG